MFFSDVKLHKYILKGNIALFQDFLHKVLKLRTVNRFEIVVKMKRK